MQGRRVWWTTESTFMLAAVDTLAIKKISDALAHCTLTIVTPGQLVLGSKVPTRNGARWTRPAARLAPADARLDAGRPREAEIPKDDSGSYKHYTHKAGQS